MDSGLAPYGAPRNDGGRSDDDARAKPARDADRPRHADGRRCSAATGFRRCIAEELPENECPPVRVKLLSERLLAWRDTQGSVWR